MKTFLLFLTSLPIAFSIVCRSDYTLINGKTCLKFFSTSATHSAAEEDCKVHAGTLAVAKNAIDNRAIASLANSMGASEIWLGLSCFNNTPSACYWDDASGTTVSYNNYMPGSPSEASGNCVEMLTGSSFGANQGKWKSVPCNNKNLPTIRSFPYVCEVPPTYSASPCDVNYNGYCYWRSSNLTLQKMDMTTAAAACAQRGSGVKLASIHSKMEVDFIKIQYRGTSVNNIWLGAKQVSGKTFSWTDGSAWDFNYIHPLDFDSKACLMMNVAPGSNGLWTMTDCSNKLDFLCKQKIAPTSTAPVVPEKPLILDSSNCNTTILMSPNQLSTYPTMTAPTTYCSWRVLALGPYKVGIYFDYWATYGVLDIFDEFGTNIGHFAGTDNRLPFSVQPPTNIGKITFTPGSGPDPDKGFHAVILPL